MRENPQVIGVLKQKGGAGATTLTIHLAAAAIEAGRHPVIVDTDPQRSASSWKRVRSAESPPVAAVDVEQLPALIRAAGEDGYDLVIVDTPPHSSARTTAVARLAHVSVIPTRPDALDLAAMPSMLALVRAVGAPHVVVLNACPRGAPEIEEARTGLGGIGAPVWPGVLGLRRAYARAIKQGKTVTEANTDAKASGEIRDLWAHVAALLSEAATSNPRRRGVRK